MNAKRAMLFAGISIAYWIAAALLILTALIGTCGMGPDAVCTNGGWTSALLATLGFVLVYVALFLWFRKR